MKVIQGREMLSVRVSKLPVINAKPKSETEILLTPPGTVTVLIARKGSDDLNAFRKAAEQGGDAAAKLLERYTKQYRGQQPLTTEQLAKGLLGASVQADIRYAGSVINSGLFVPAQGQEVSGNRFPYNGGRLASEGFELVEYFEEGTKGELEGLVIVSAPPLSDAEKAALRLVPRDELTTSVGAFPLKAKAKWCNTTWGAVGGAALFVAAGAMAYTEAVACTVILVARDKALSDSDLKKLSPTASAAQILQVRRKVYEDLVKQRGA
jgi:hypothetical protein